MLKAICCSNCVKVGKESYSKGYMDALEHFKKELELAAASRPIQIIIKGEYDVNEYTESQLLDITNDLQKAKEEYLIDEPDSKDHLIHALQVVMNLINNLESYGALKHEHDWPKVLHVKAIVSEALLDEGRLL